jgi:hypothetical protein
MASHPSSSNHGGPSYTNKEYYQSRQGVSATSTPNLGFNKTTVGMPHGLYQGTVEGYTDINGSAPSAMERGVPSAQNSKGR